MKKLMKKGQELIVEISMLPNAFKLKNQISIRGRRHWEYIFVGFLLPFI